MQARLKEEYERMEIKLKEMESRLQEGQSGSNGAAEERLPAVSGRSLNGNGK